MMYAAASLGILLLLILFARPRRRRTGLHMTLRRLRTSPEQERTIREAVWDIRVAAGRFVRNVRGARPELAALLREEVLDEKSVQAWFSAHERHLEELKPRLLQGVREIHASLDPKQREKLSRLVENSNHGLFGRRHSHGI